MAVYSRKSERSFNAILDLLDRKHLLHMRVYRDSLLKNRGMLDIYDFSKSERDCLILDHDHGNTRQKGNMIKLRPFFGEKRSNKELKRLLAFFEENLKSDQQDLRDLVQLYKNQNPYR